MEHRQQLLANAHSVGLAHPVLRHVVSVGGHLRQRGRGGRRVENEGGGGGGGTPREEKTTSDRKKPNLRHANEAHDKQKY